MSKKMYATRREFIQRSVLLAGGMTGISNVLANSESVREMAVDDFKLSIFSKHLQWLGFEEMGKVVADLGFDGIDLTVRPAGHVLPEKVTLDLPRAVEAIRKAGIDVYMLTTAVQDANDPHTENIIRTASSLGIKHYRLGWYTYAAGKSIEDNLRDFEHRLNAIAALNRKYGVFGEYQNHSGLYFGAPVWDLHHVIRKINSKWLGVQYDLFHATVEGANAWPLGYELISPYIKSLDFKDFAWTKKNNKWIAEVVPIGEGMVDFATMFAKLKQSGLRVPLSAHFEYGLGGAEHGATELTIPRDEVTAAMKRDCAKIRSMLQSSGLIP